MPLDPEFIAALEKQSVELDETVAQRLQDYATCMWGFNEQLNLTRHTTWDLFVSRDLRDCLQLAPLIQPGEEVLDLGSGNGIPGIPLAILRPDVEVALAESVAKRAAVLAEMIEQLQLPVPVYSARGEDLMDDFRFTTIVCRAVGSITKLCRWFEDHWASVDRMLLIKGPKWVEERGEARHLGVLANLEVRRVAEYPLGDDSGENQGAILQIWPKGREPMRSV
ncbi:16S rRNA (guanine(527)-N(7))-methyltransferase RsmG [Stieleria varia]|uniref:Ribosomal RNA small subunit methyltransferase G n=1 Tax=Stieleria varia TaxID=2528005 RepID=A0A5C6AXK6_9BACT|nr:16S rRNA (guanine(527)-N(7))-methyltransferase RsmG [Stieleria varia]TWU04358.1 Ribosomal RNA small subunit methyltransferase G [Stieleria varia]